VITDRLTIAPAVAAALRGRRPVVALESTLISHGLPYPENLEVACAAEAAVTAAGATPATIAIRAGRILVGLDQPALDQLATAPAGSVVKAARPNLAAALSVEGWAATTVSATMIAAAAAGIRVFATGGIGGVHRGAASTLDISSDLDELARTRVVVVCAGPKSILDVPATMEYLETRGVPVVTIGQDEIPGFYARSSGVRTPWRVEDPVAAEGRHHGLQVAHGRIADCHHLCKLCGSVVWIGSAQG
jgi:pseudouridine-5'-phosphate glycosidase